MGGRGGVDIKKKILELLFINLLAAPLGFSILTLLFVDSTCSHGG